MGIYGRMGHRDTRTPLQTRGSVLICLVDTECGYCHTQYLDEWRFHVRVRKDLIETVAIARLRRPCQRRYHTERRDHGSAGGGLYHQRRLII